MFRLLIGNIASQISLNNKQREAYYKETLSGFLTKQPPLFKIYAKIVENFKNHEYKDHTSVSKIKTDIYRLQWHYFYGKYNIKSKIVRADVNNTPQILFSLLRVVYTIELIKKGGIFIHAASFVRDNKGFLFLGKSGAGKSTLIQMVTKAAPEIDPLTDEISCVCIENQKAFVYSTPFWGNGKAKGRHIKAPLAAVYFINKANKNSTESIKKKEAVQNILTNTLFASLDQETLDLGLNIIDRIVKMADCRILNFKKDASFLMVI